MEEIIDNIMQTPDNTNPNVLRSQLQGTASGGSNVLVVHEYESDDKIILDKTWKEIYDAPLAVVRHESESSVNIELLHTIKVINGKFKVTSDEYTYITYSENGYPALGES